jgi:competence protein ComEC
MKIYHNSKFVFWILIFILFITPVEKVHCEERTLQYIENEIRISPRHNSFYRSNPQDLYFTVHHPSTAIDSIYFDKKSIKYSRYNFTNFSVDNKTLKLPFTSVIKINEAIFAAMDEGGHILEIKFGNGDVEKAEIDVNNHQPEDYKMEIISFNVSHGDAVFINLPDRNILIDTGPENMTKKRVIPFLKKYGVKTIDYVIITHWHYDHYSGLDHIENAFEIGEVWYNLSAQGKAESGHDHYQEFKVGNEIKIGQSLIKIFNAAHFDTVKYPAYKSKYFEKWTGKNNRSLSFNLQFNGFKYSHGGDIYQHPQKAILKTFGEQTVKAHVYHGNHHFHGGLSTNYLKKVNPYLFITPAEAAVYNRSAYVEQVMGEVVPYLEANSNRLIENLLDFEVGHIIIRVNDSTDWKYETCYENYWLSESLLNNSQPATGINH